MKKFFITTAIDYPSGPPHAGHMYEKICTDVIARWKQLNGSSDHFSTGTDCHGLKIQRATGLRVGSRLQTESNQITWQLLQWQVTGPTTSQSPRTREPSLTIW